MARVLVVEDDKDQRDALVEMLRKRNHQPVEAESVAAARQLMQDGSFDVVISDFNLPDGNGVQLATWMQELLLRTPFILATGKEQGDIIREAPAYEELMADGRIALQLGKPIRSLMVDMALQAVLPAHAGERNYTVTVTR